MGAYLNQIRAERLARKTFPLKKTPGPIKARHWGNFPSIWNEKKLAVSREVLLIREASKQKKVLSPWPKNERKKVQ